MVMGEGEFGKRGATGAEGAVGGHDRPIPFWNGHTGP